MRIDVHPVQILVNKYNDGRQRAPCCAATNLCLQRGRRQEDPRQASSRGGINRRVERGDEIRVALSAHRFICTEIPAVQAISLPITHRGRDEIVVVMA